MLYINKYIYIYIRNLKQELNHGFVLKNFHRTIKSNQNAWVWSYIDMNTGLKKKQKMVLKKTFLSWWIMQFLGKNGKCEKT